MQKEILESTTISIFGRKGLGKTVGSSILINNLEKETLVFDITGAYTKDTLVKDALYLTIDTRVDNSVLKLILEQFKEHQKIVLDMSRLTRRELVEFTELMFKLINSVGDVAVVIDEVGEVASQQREYYSPELERCVRIGRNYGIKPFIMITQRTQKVDKNILALSDYYIVFGLTHNLDLKAVQELTGLDNEQFEPLKKSIKNMGVGKCEVIKFTGENQKAYFDLVSNSLREATPQNTRQQEIIKNIKKVEK